MEPELTQEEAEQDELSRLMQETAVDVGGTAESLVDVVKDIKVAHQELDAYKSGALSLSNSLDERILEAKNAGEDELIDVLTDLKESAFGVYLRLQRGDLELLGHRDGKHSGYFAPDEPGDEDSDE